MPLYETVIIARNDVTQQQVETIVDSLTAAMDAENGFVLPEIDPALPAGEPRPLAEGSVVKKREYWGLRGLAYRIKKNRKGHYVLLNINAPSVAVVELERQLKINEDVLRYITVKVDQFDVSSNKNRRDEAKPEGEAVTEEAAI